MSKLTALKYSRRHQERVQLYLDGKYAFSLTDELVAKKALQVGQELADDELDELRGAEHGARCFYAATRYLAHRPQSEQEITDKLLRRGFSAADVQAVAQRLKKSGMLDDAAFTRYWQQQRDAFSPRGQWLVERELKQKGVSEDVIRKTARQVDETESACRAAEPKLRVLPRDNYDIFRHRLGGFLHRRGFSYDVIRETIQTLWQQHGATETPEE